MSDTPIRDHAMLSNRHTAALVDLSGSIEWLCMPRFDSPSIFGRLLDPTGGHWAIRPAEPFEVTRHYVPETLVLQSAFTTSTGTLQVTDALGLSPHNSGHRIGVNPAHALVRHVTCTAGFVDVDVEFEPKLDYARGTTVAEPAAAGLRIHGGGVELLLTCPDELPMNADTRRGSGRLTAGASVYFALQFQPEDLSRPLVQQADLAAMLAQTTAAWSSWTRLHVHYDGPWAEEVHHSGRVLHGLSYQPTGAIVAAATTSLPESVGGARNWDYRYSWVRDASLTLEALWVAACPDEALDFFSFIAAAAASSQDPPGAPDLQVLFTVAGDRDIPEHQLGHWSGWRGSRPVRIGNAAADQHQLDIYGELLAAAHRLRNFLGAMTPDVRALLVHCADAAATQWDQPDHGIWEIRGPRQHFLHSKVMCWVALDRAIDMADLLDASHRVPEWARARAAVRTLVLDQGWSDTLGAYSSWLGSATLDAAALTMPLVGFLPASDPRMMATIDAIERRLTDPAGLVYRYQTEDEFDGLDGEEGTFLLCTFWLAEALALAGHPERATRVFERAASAMNDVGLLAEEVDPHTGQLLGNFPQAFSHIGLINAAWAINLARQGALDDGSAFVERLVDFRPAPSSSIQPATPIA